MNNYIQMTFTNKEISILSNCLYEIINKYIRLNALNKLSNSELDYFNNLRNTYYKINSNIDKNIIYNHINNERRS